MNKELVEKFWGGYTDKTHDEVLDKLEERFKKQKTTREIPYYKNDGKEHPDYKGDIDLMVSFDDLTVFYEVKSDATFGNLKKAQEQLDRQCETFEGQTENVRYKMKLGNEEIDYTPYLEHGFKDFEEDVL